MAKRPALHALADRAGILSEYVDTTGTRRFTSDEARVSLLAALGLDGSSEESALHALREWKRRSEERILEPTVIRRHDAADALALRARVPRRLRDGAFDYHLELRTEGGEVQISEGRTRLRGKATRFGLELPVAPDPGYHELNLNLRSASGEFDARSRLIVSPGSCLTTEELQGSRKLYGLWTHLYAVRSVRNWGVGDFTDLESLLEWAAEIGAAFVGINPLHALRNSGDDISPYSPVSRLFRNVVYLDLDRVPELAECPEARVRLESRVYREALSGLRGSDRVDYEAVMALKLPVLESLYETFRDRHRDRGSARGAAYSRFLSRKGRPLTDFATFLALARHFREQGVYDWRAWPPSYRHPEGPEVERFAHDHFDEVDRHRYVQFELDRQLEGIAERGRSLGLPIGIYGDLAIGTAADACDTWMYPELFVNGVHLGAPPDDYSASGQEWGLPPLDPRRIREDGYRYWTALLRNNLEHTGALRIDHVMGLFRQWWVPAGRLATEGAYVRFPAKEMLAVLAIESRRNGALIIGEDLGTVPRGLPSQLARWGILSYRVLYFERDEKGRFRRSGRYSKRALVTANTHDHPPLAGILEGRDIELAQETGTVEEPEKLDRWRHERAEELRSLLRRLVQEGCLESADGSHSYSDLCAAVHEFLSKTPAPLMAIRLGDLLGETEPLNIPGVPFDRYPNWSRRLSSELEAMKDDPVVTRGLEGAQGRRND